LCVSWPVLAQVRPFRFVSQYPLDNHNDEDDKRVLTLAIEGRGFAEKEEEKLFLKNRMDHLER
jgi:hypothetical protein